MIIMHLIQLGRPLQERRKGHDPELFAGMDLDQFVLATYLNNWWCRLVQRSR
jgi:hypothetical protein